MTTLLLPGQGGDVLTPFRYHGPVPDEKQRPNPTDAHTIITRYFRLIVSLWSNRPAAATVNILLGPRPLQDCITVIP